MLWFHEASEGQNIQTMKYYTQGLAYLHLCVFVSISSRRMNPRLVRMERPRMAMIHVITGLQKMYVPINRATPEHVCMYVYM